jgi:hypothetical protein
MSLVQSVFNQIGREIGRDIYRSSKSIKSESSPSDIDIIKSLLKEIDDFELSSHDKNTIKKLANLVNKSSVGGNISARNFMFDSIYVNLDEKIDFARKYVDESYLEDIDKLDKENNFNYLAILESHRIWIDRQIQNLEKKDYKKSNKFIFILKGPWVILAFLLSLPLFGMIFTDGGQFAIVPILFFLLPALIFRHSKYSEIESKKQKELDFLNELKSYYNY